VRLDDEAAEALSSDIVAATQALVLLIDDTHRDLIDGWWTALRQLVDRGDVARLIGGACARLSLNAERMATSEAEECMSRALARGTEPADAARWIEGFLSPNLPGSGLVLATSSRLFDLVDTWLMGLSADYFSQVLPLLRRTTSGFSRGERNQIAMRVRAGATSLAFGTSDEVDAARAALVEPIVLAILGVEGERG
jgi:hypothetical protein